MYYKHNAKKRKDLRIYQKTVPKALSDFTKSSPCCSTPTIWSNDKNAFCLFYNLFMNYALRISRSSSHTHTHTHTHMLVFVVYGDSP